MSKIRTREAEIDWASIRARLAMAEDALDGALKLSPQRAKALLDQRAKLLARPPGSAEHSIGAGLTVATFALANERYAIETKYIREISRLVELTPVPGAGDFLVGVTNLRGEILAVIDLRRFFGLSQPGLTDLSRMLVLGGQRNEFGVLADQTHEIVAMRSDEVLTPPESVAGIGRRYVTGVTKIALIVLDGAALLADPRLYIDYAETGTATARPE